MIDAKHYFADDTLSDGTPVVVRAIRMDDRSAILAAFRGLDRESVYTRFFTYKKALTDQELHAITDVDFDSVVALVAIGPPEKGAPLIGGGRYAAAPGRDAATVAELAFVSAGEWRSRGVASLLLRHLVRIAREQGLTRFEAEVLAQNGAMLGVFRRSGLPMTTTVDGDTIHVSLALAPLA